LSGFKLKLLENDIIKNNDMTKKCVIVQYRGEGNVPLCMGFGIEMP